MDLLQAAAVDRGDGNWQSGYQYDAPGCAMHSSTSEICDGGTRHECHRLSSRKVMAIH